MMQTMRRAAQGFLAAGLFGLLILSFALWGVGDMFAPSTGMTDTVIQIGDRGVTGAELRRRVDDEMRGVQLPDPSLEVQRAVRMQVANQVTQQIVTSNLFLEAAERMDVAISDAALAASIRNDPAFRDDRGNFSRNRYEQLVRQRLGMTPVGYEQTVRRPEMKRNQLVEAVVGGVEPPRALVEAIHAYRGERRTVDIAFVPAAEMTDVPAPTEDELRAYHEANPDAFTAPEYRKLTVVLADPARLAETVEVTDAQLERAYEDNKDRYATPETREIRQILFGPGQREAAMAAYERIQDGESFASVARESVTGMAENLGEMRRGQLGDPALDQAVFAAEEGAVTEPVESPLGWHIFKVEAVSGGEVETLEEVREELVEQIRANEAVTLARELGNALDAEVGGGTPLEEAAEIVGLPVIEVPAMDREGLNRAGEPVAGLPRDPAITEEAFDTPEDELSFLAETEDRGWFLLRVEEVIDSAVRPFAEARDDVREAWLAEQREKAAAEIAERIAATVREGVTLPAAGEGPGISVRTVERASRDSEDIGEHVNQALIDKIFAAEEGQPVTGAVQGGHTVAVPREVRPADPDADLSELTASLRGAMQNDLVVQLGAELRESIGVEVDQETIQTVMEH